MVAYLTTTQIVFGAILVTGIGSLFTFIPPILLSAWIWAIPTAIGSALMYTAILRLYSDAVDESAQGWIMGVSSAIAAICWAFAGIPAALFAQWSAQTPLIWGAILQFVSLFILAGYMRQKPKQAEIPE